MYENSNKIQNTEFLKLLCNHTVAQLPTSTLNKVVEIDSDTSLVDGFQTLLDHHISSVPVWNKRLKCYSGFLDVRDLVSCVVFASEQRTSLVSLHEVVSKRYDKSVTVTYLSRRNAFKPVPKNASICDVATKLALGSLHRVPIVNEEGRVIRIVTQSSLCKFFQEHSELLSNDLSQTLEGLGIAHKDVVAVGSDSLALDTFKTMDQTQLSGLAVVDYSGALIGNTSSSDLKLVVKQGRAFNLTLPILDFLRVIRQKESIQLACFPNTSIGKVIKLLAATHSHRVFVISRHKRPIGVVSITDILRFATANKNNIVLKNDEVCHDTHCAVCITAAEMEQQSDGRNIIPISPPFGSLSDSSPNRNVFCSFIKHSPVTKAHFSSSHTFSTHLTKSPSLSNDDSTLTPPPILILDEKLKTTNDMTKPKRSLFTENKSTKKTKVE